MLLSTFASALVMVGVMTVNDRKIQPPLRTSIITVLYTTAAFICYPIGGYADISRWLASSIVTWCWNFDNNFSFDAAIDNLETGWTVYFWFSLVGSILGFIFYRLVLHMGNSMNKYPFKPHDPKEE
jgi:glycerol uptake facilitator-like aquaporin